MWGPRGCIFDTPGALFIVFFFFFAALCLYVLYLCLDHGSLVMEKHTKHICQGVEAKRFKMDWGVRLRLEVQVISLSLGEGRKLEGQGDQLGGGYSRKAGAAESQWTLWLSLQNLPAASPHVRMKG